MVKPFVEQPKDVEQGKDQQYSGVLFKKMNVAQDVEQPQFVEQPLTVEQPHTVEQPKDVEQRKDVEQGKDVEHRKDQRYCWVGGKNVSSTP